MPLSIHDAFAEAMRLSGLIDQGIDALKRHAEGLARAEQAYRRGKAQAWARAAGMDMLAKEKEAWVDAESADLRYQRDLEDGMRQAALEAVRSRRTQVSALQTLVNAEREGAAFARTGPECAA